MKSLTTCCLLATLLGLGCSAPSTPSISPFKDAVHPSTTYLIHGKDTVNVTGTTIRLLQGDYKVRWDNAQQCWNIYLRSSLETKNYINNADTITIVQ